jgi:transcriptional regulator with XRE-family HTH domain
MYYNEFLSLLGERIRALCKEKNIKQEKLAELVDKVPLLQLWSALYVWIREN